LTLHQPGASAIAYGGKLFETRSWRPPDALVGTRLAIHAARTKPSDADLRDSISWLASASETHLGWLLETDAVSWWRDISISDRRVLVLHPGLLPRGAIVATAVIGVVLPADEAAVPHRRAEEMVGDFSPGRWAWRLDDVRRLRTPVPFTGGQGLFTVDDETQEQIRKESDADADADRASPVP
jgi:hypothetical protein